MENCNCTENCKTYCIVEVIVSILIGVVVGILFANGLIPVTLNFIKIALAVSAIAMAILGGSLFSANIIRGCNNFKKCICYDSICLLVSAFGTLIAATITAAAGLIVTSIVSILGVALSAFFYAWLLLSIFSLMLCLINKTCD